MPRAGSKYAGAHRGTRAAWQATLDAGALIACWRCGRRIERDPKRWQLGHRTEQPSAPECNLCNMRAGGRVGAAITNARRARRPLHSRQW